MASITLPLAIGPVLGPVLGGIILSVLSWRWLFLVNVPIIAIGFLLAAWALPKGGAQPKDKREPLDVIGLILLAPGLAGVLLGLTELSSHGGLNHGAVLIPLVAGVGLLAAFVGWALRLTGRRPIVDLRLLRARSLATACATLFTTHATLYAGLFLLPLYYQNVRHDSVLAAGLLLIPQGLGVLASRFVVGRMVDRLGARAVTVLCFVLAGLTTVPFALADSHTSQLWLGIVLAIRGFAVGALIIPATSVAYNDVVPATIPHATMNTRIAQQLGASFGVAIVAVVLQSALAHGSVSAFHQAFWWATGIAIVGLIPALGLPVRRIT